MDMQIDNKMDDSINLLQLGENIWTYIERQLWSCEHSSEPSGLIKGW
jgi:hypothetical protein